MAKPSITLGGKTRLLRYDMNALPELEGALHLTIEELGQRFKRDKIGTREIRALVWAGLLHEDEFLSIRAVGTWLSEAGFLKDKTTQEELMKRVFEALADEFPEAAKDIKADDPN